MLRGSAAAWRHALQGFPAGTQATPASGCRACKADQDDEVWGDLADEYWRAGEHELAKQAWQRAHGMDPGDGEWTVEFDRGWLIFEASSANLIAGQSYIGEFEARMRDLVAQIGGGRRVVLGVDVLGRYKEINGV